MPDFVVIGTDTDVGKTTFALLWLSAFADRYDYWKPLETGPSDSEAIQSLCASIVVQRPVLHFDEAVAPLLAARYVNQVIPSARDLADARPTPLPGCSLLIETFGSAFSPLNETEDQLALLRALRSPTVLISTSTLGAIGRTRQALESLYAKGLAPAAVVLLGPADAFTEEMLQKVYPSIAFVSIQPPAAFTTNAIAEAAQLQKTRLEKIQAAVARASRKSPLSVESIIQRDAAGIWHPYTPLRPSDAPLACIGARDEFLNLADGRRVIDGISSWWTILHGHRFAPLVKALQEAAEQIDHVHFAGVTHPWAVELAELLLQSMPWRGGRVFYSDNGSTAVEVALKMAFQYWQHHGQAQRKRFVGFEHGYHGDTFGAMAVSRDPLFFGRFEPLLFQADILPLEPNRLDDFLTEHGKHVAGVILEPLVQGAGGMRMHTPESLHAIFEVTRQHDVLFIADEVMTGGGRTGYLWAFLAANIEPDLVCAAKTLAGGMLPLAATLASPRIVEGFDSADRTRTFFHGHSFTAHPLACAVAVANWRLATPELAAPRLMESFWQQALMPLREHPRVADLRMRGSIAAIEIHAAGGYLADIGRQLYQSCLSHDVLLRPLGNVLYAMPPFCTSAESLNRIAVAMIETVARCS